MEEVFKIWKDTRNPNGRGRSIGSLWEVSNMGHVRRNGIEQDDHIARNGYAYVAKGGGLGFLHRAVAALFVDNPDNKPEVDHIDGNRLNNCSDNLRWVTSTENKLNPNTYIEHINAEIKHKISESHKGCKWMNDGTKDFYVKSEDVQNKLQQGLVFGRLPFKKIKT